LAHHGTIAVVTIDNPPVNALSQAVRSGLIDCFDEAEANTATTAIVLLCAGRTFVAGADIREFDLPPLAPHLPDVIARIETCANRFTPRCTARCWAAGSSSPWRAITGSQTVARRSAFRKSSSGYCRVRLARSDSRASWESKGRST